MSGIERHGPADGTILRGDAAELSAGRIESAALAGDAAAEALWTDVAERLGLAVGNAVTLWNPRVLVLGGGVLSAAPKLRQRVVENVMRTAWHGHRERLVIAPLAS